MLKEFSLEGRCGLVTGGNKGLGYAMARALALAGANVAIGARHREELEAAAHALSKETSRRFVPIVADVTCEEQVEAMTGEVIETFGQLDVLVNNAGINIRNPALKQSEAEFRRIIDTNLVGAFLVARSVGRHMFQRGSGSVINVASMIGTVGLADRPGYTASKAGLVNLTRTLALEWASKGVRVNALCPGPFATAINTEVIENPEANKFFLDRIPMGRWGQPEELGGAVVFLASDASRFMTGATLVVDGGWTAH